MRRCFAGALLLVLLAQSSGVAVAKTPSGPSLNGFDLGAMIVAMQSAITSSLLFAVVTGTQGRYAAIHAPPPVIERPRNNVSAASLMRSQHAVRPQGREGTPQLVVMPNRSALDPRHRRLDPLTMRHSTVKPLTPKPDFSAPISDAAVLEPLRVLSQAPIQQGNHKLSSGRGKAVKPLTTLSNAGAGIEHWWTYENRPIPGIGKAMVNVGTGNLIVSAMDVDVPEQGIDLAFQRTYNSQSLHDANGDDGADPSIFGNGWTNNFDANIVYNSASNTITVYDMDGTPCIYTSNGTGGWIPCTGEYATLVPTDQYDCTYAWTKPNGTVYWFHTDGGGVGFGCGITQAQKGHIQEIFARNQSNHITFTYSYNGGGYSSENVTKIVATHSDGDTLTMNFGTIPGSSINELQTITLPDGNAELQYLYDSNGNGNLLEVDKPGNNAAFPAPSPPPGHPALPGGDVPETYAYANGAMQEACGPRCTVAMWANANNPTDGSALLFSFSGSQLSQWQVQGVLNFTPTDGTGIKLQSGSTQFQAWYTAYFIYGAQQSSPCGNTTGSTTTMCDTDGHGTIWTIDSSDRITETQDFTGTAEGTYIVKSQTWNGSNNLTSTTDANGNVTQYGYDNNMSLGFDCCGNLVEMQLPQTSDITNGPLSPLSYYSYDVYNNVVAYCDPVYNQTKGNSWKPNPGATPCPASATSGTAYFKYDTSDSNEVYGCLTNIYKPSEYQTIITYGGGTGNCGNGLPTRAKATLPIADYDGQTRTPTQNFGYDTKGNLASYDKGNSNSGNALDSWTLHYGDDNRNDYKTQNDAIIPNAAMTSYSCHYPDGSLLYTQTPSQHATDGQSCPGMNALLNNNYNIPKHSTSYYYDLDGDQIKMIDRKGCSTNTPCVNPDGYNPCIPNETNPNGTTCKYYDGLDRLVETIEPWDERTFNNGTKPYEFYAFRWMTRYIYDLSQNGGSGSMNISDTTGSTASFAAYGNLFKTQEYLPQVAGEIGTLAHGQYLGNSAAWNDVRGTSFDGLDRAISKYELAFGTAAVTTNTYDGNGYSDYLTKVQNAIGQVTKYYYDQVGHVQQVTFSGTAPVADGRTYTYDADGRTASATNSLGTLSYTYDVDGNKKSVMEPSQYHNPSLICYGYYPDGLREYLSIGTPNDSCGHISFSGSPGNGGIEQGRLFSYGYTNDGLLRKQLVTWGSNSEPFTWTYFPSGRENTETDPLNGQTVYWPPNGTPSVNLGTKSYTYDPYGRVNQLTLPEGWSGTAYVYDDDDELVGFNQAATTRYFTLNARGELLEDTPDPNNNPGAAWAQGPTSSANGAQVGNGITPKQGYSTVAPPTTLAYDVRSNMVTCSTDPGWNSGLTGDDIYTYDAAGRQVSKGYDSSGNCASAPSNGATQYDAENHIQSTTVASMLLQGDTSGSVQLGPDGRHHVDTHTVGSTGVDFSAHWDGDTLLFSKGGNGNLGPLLYIGKLGVMDLAGDIYISDRDQTGTQVTAHASTPSLPPPNGGHGNAWFDGWSTGNVRPLYIYKNGQQLNLEPVPGSCNIQLQVGNQWNYYQCPLFNPVFTMQRADGYGMIGGLVQGARTYDPTSGQWLTPDAYPGNVADPMSQKPFVWNGNNAMEWSDPTGYCTDPAPGQKPNGCLGGVDWNLNMNYGNMLKEILMWVAIPAGGEAAAGAKAAVIAGRVADEQVAKAIMSITDRKLGNIANNLFRAVDRVLGGTAGAVRREIQNNTMTGGKWHLGKAEQEIRALEKWISKNPNASQQNIQAAQTLLKDLQDAVNSSGSVPTIHDLFEQGLHNQTPPNEY